jgi:predicted glycosyltransferase
MKIWVDLSNSPHVLFFKEMIIELKKKHHVVVTCRHLANTKELLELQDFDYEVIGRHYGKNPVKKLMGLKIRSFLLYQYLKRKSIDVSISHSSFYSPIVSKLLGIPCIYLNDNEHAAGNRISFIFADRIMIPEFLAIKKVLMQGAKVSKIIQYPGVKEGVYLWNYKSKKLENTTDLENDKTKKTIYIRPEPMTAQYYKGKINFIDNMLIDLRKRYRIVLLPRSNYQKIYYKQEQFKGIEVAEKTIPLEDIISKCDLFIGAGGTMTREAAVLGIPTISIYQEKLLDVDQYLIQKGSMVHNPLPNADHVKKYISKTKKREANKSLLLKGRQAYKLIYDTLLSIGKKEM